MVKKSNNTKRPNGSGSICFETATQKWRGAIGFTRLFLASILIYFKQIIGVIGTILVLSLL